MIILNKFLIAAISFFCCALASAGEAIIFDDPGLIGYKDDGAVAGIYSSYSGRFSCIFLFAQKENSRAAMDKDGFSDTKIITFAPSNEPFLSQNREKTFDIDGNLYRKSGAWVIKTSTGQAGCESSAGVFTFDLDTPNARIYHVVRKIPATGIRLVKSKSYFYDYKEGKYIVRKGYLTQWDSVVLLRVKDEFSYVRFVDPHADLKSSGNVTTGWVHSNDLTNPLPSLK